MEDDDKEKQGNLERISIVDPFARRLISCYLKRRESDIESLKCSLAEDDFDYIRIKGHNLSGSGVAYGLDKVSEFGKILEEAATERNPDAIAEQIDLLENYLHNLVIN